MFHLHALPVPNSPLDMQRRAIARSAADLLQEIYNQIYRPTPFGRRNNTGGVMEGCPIPYIVMLYKLRLIREWLAICDSFDTAQATGFKVRWGQAILTTHTLAATSALFIHVDDD